MDLHALVLRRTESAQGTPRACTNLTLRFAKVVFLVAAIVTPLAFVGPTGGEPDPELTAIAAARKYLEERELAPRTQDQVSNFDVVGFRESPGGRHVHFQQTINGLPLLGAYVSVSLTKSDNSKTLMTDSSRPSIQSSGVPITVTAAGAIAKANNVLGVRGTLRAPATADAIYYPIDSQLAVQAWQVLVPAIDPLGDWLVVVSAQNGQPLHIDNLMANDHPGAVGDVFDPNPVVSSGSVIPPPTDCDSAANAAALAGEIVTRTLLGIDAGQGKLVGPYVDLTAPGIVGGYKPAGVADEATHVYGYTCDDDRFEEVMVYYHVDTVQRLIQSLGFTGASAIHDFPIPAHAHYFAGCNAFYSTLVGGIHFGDGCKIGTVQAVVDRAEDDDVIVHEYGHAIQDDQVAGIFFSTAEGRGLAEGFSDFLAATVSGDPCMFEWSTAIATELLGITCAPALKDPDFGPFRNLVNDLVYPDDINADEHVSGLIWGGALWDLVLSFGGDEAARLKALELALQSNFYLNSSAEFADAAAAVRQADIDIFGGADLDTIATVFYERGIPLDSDGDGCHDGAEVQSSPGSETSGGQRSSKNPWDFYDVAGLSGPTPDGVIDLLFDVLGVIQHYSPTGAPPYDAHYDRGPTTGPNAWNMTAPDGVIDLLNDILGVIRQHGHDCR